MCSERKQKEISEVLKSVKVDIVAGQETWERNDGYKWFGKPRIDQNSRRGEGGVGFLVCECIAEEVDVRYEESVWMKVRGGRALYLCCVCAAAVIEDGYERLKEDVLEYQQKGRVVLLGDFNARVGKSTDVDDVIGSNRNGNKLISFLNELELVICYGRRCVSEPEWARVRTSLHRKSVIDKGSLVMCVLIVQILECLIIF